MLNLILFGAPGAGKGTQAARLQERYGLAHFSTGDMLRAEAAAGTPLGRSIQRLINEGAFVSDEIVMQVISGKIAENMTARGFIFDGVPRTITQARTLGEILQTHDLSIAAALLLEADEDELASRMLIRGKISGRPDDQNEDIIRRRIRLYHEKTEPLAQYYREQGKFFAISGTGRVADVFEALCRVVDGLPVL